MSEPKNEYALIGFQWEVLALIVGMWAKERYGVDLEQRLGQNGLKTLVDDDFCRLVARRFRQHWIKPNVPDPDRQERVAALLVQVDEMVEELFKESSELQDEFQRKCEAAGCDLEDQQTDESPASAVS